MKTSKKYYFLTYLSFRRLFILELKLVNFIFMVYKQNIIWFYTYIQNIYIKFENTFF